ncbi:succinyl-CoA synthetase beta subunit [Propionibacterium cyclohexanicum]|uniref:Succinate--CoA ligase [ADP-forming] subunit beta n=1 Tax=Propionibacterium cyclohexanicum TaxID=64702 RepID=A0A1H9QIK3_9ACTN|nr:succinyl-CoA synthetase beta subunit [Propionibacterium cyclohexanicum]
MDLYEYQAQELFSAHHIAVPRGILARTPAQARQAAVSLGSPVVVVKAQVKAGGRGKAGGIAVCHSAQECEAAAERILTMTIKGHVVRAVLVVEGIDIAAEYYFSLLVDRAERRWLALCSAEGGVDIETLARERSEALARVPVSPRSGLDAKTAARLVRQAGFADELREELVATLVKLGEVFVAEDALLVEVNPLVLTRSGQILAADAKVSLDDNALFRHRSNTVHRDDTGVHELELRAAQRGLNYVRLGGEVGIIGNGAGLVMSTLDVVARAGEDLPGSPRPANFLDIGGGASAQVMADALDIVLSDPQVCSVFVNIFGGITACDEVAHGIVRAVELVGKLPVPVVVRLDGNNVEQGREILREAADPAITLVETMDDAARRAAELAVHEPDTGWSPDAPAGASQSPDAPAGASQSQDAPAGARER